MTNQETEGLLSPLIRDVRLKQVASYIKKNSTVLDLACGAGYLSKFLPEGCKYYGVDRIPAPETDKFSDFINLDLSEASSLARIREWIPKEPDYITCVAFVEHISNPTEFISEYSSLLKKRGKLVGTTPHPYGRLIHECMSRLYLCSRHGADEHEKFLGKNEIKEIALASGGNLITYIRFLFGLNQLFIIEYT